MSRKINYLKWAGYLFVFLILYVIQTTPSIFPISLPFLLIGAVVALAMFEGEITGAVFGVIFGLIWDIQFGSVIGFNALILMIIGVFAGLMISSLLQNKMISFIIITAIGISFHSLIKWFFFTFLWGTQTSLMVIAYSFLSELLLGLLFSIPLYFGAKYLCKRFARIE
jgi:rod shape-determining protein MreD